MNETNLSRRAQYHSKKPKKKRGGGLSKLIAVLVTVVILVSALGLFMWHTQEEKAKETFQAKASELQTSVQKDLEKSGIPLTPQTKGDWENQVISFLPTEENAAVDNLTGELDSLVKTAQKKLGDQLGRVIAYIDVHHVTDQLTEYLPTATLYTWNKSKESFTEKDFTSENVSYINQSTQQALTAADLFPERADLLGMFSVLQQKILDQSADGSKVIDAVLNLARPTTDDLNFTYAADKITVHLGENETGVSDVEIPFTDISPYVNSSFVDPANLTDPNAQLDPNKKYIALTFDDGPSAAYTPQLLQTLESNDVKATFFTVGENVSGNEAILQKILADGNEIGNHSWDHPDLASLATEAVEKEIRDTSKAIYLATGKLPHLVRPPYGSANAETAEAIGLPIINWNLDSTDWELQGNPSAIQQKVLGNAYNGAIILIHDIHESSVQAVPGIIESLKAEGYEFVTVSQLLGGTKPLYQYFGLYQGKNDSRLVK